MKLEDIFTEIVYDMPFRFNKTEILGLEELLKDKAYSTVLNELIEKGKNIVLDGQQRYLELLESELVSIGFEIKRPEKTAFYLFKYSEYAEKLFDDCKKAVALFGSEYLYSFTCNDEDGCADFKLCISPKYEVDTSVELDLLLKQHFPITERIEKYRCAESSFSFYISKGY